jgi:hypothetical protein
LREFLYSFVNNRVINFIGSPFLGIVIPPIVALYYGTLDIWGDEWDIVKNYKVIHEFIFLVLAAFTIFVLFLRGIAEQLRGSIGEKYHNILQAMVAYSNELVKKKRDRFFQKAKSLKPSADVFRKITQSKDQIDYALDGTKRLLNSAFNIDHKNIAITIIQGSVGEDKWWYEFKCDTQKQHTKARDIMNGSSTAKYCYETGESIFIPDIRKGVKEGVFSSSERSNKAKVGSIYCKPVRVKVDNIDYTYIFTVVVYGQFMCTPYDEAECRACEKLLDEVADRIELELYLHSMKSFKENGGKAV